MEGCSSLVSNAKKICFIFQRSSQFRWSELAAQNPKIREWPARTVILAEAPKREHKEADEGGSLKFLAMTFQSSRLAIPFRIHH